jgi:hypothetical protein
MRCCGQVLGQSPVILDILFESPPLLADRVASSSSGAFIETFAMDDSRPLG